LTPFVGREQELATLHTLLAHAEQGRGQAVGLVGEAGLGKSRLLYELRRSIAGRQVLYLTGCCLSYGSTTPYLPIIDLVRQHCGLTESDSLETVQTQLRHSLQAGDMAPICRAPYLQRLLGAPDDTATVVSVSPDAVTRQIHAAVQQLSLHSSHRQLLIMEIEDLHWIDPSSEAYLSTLVGRLPGAALLLLTTYRPGYAPAWMGKSYATQIALQPLASQASQRTLQTLLQSRPAADALLPVILAKAHGNPFFLEELARTAVV
jgi:predicted ATPase